MNKDTAILIGGNGLTYVLTALQSNEVFQIVELSFSIVLTAILIFYRVWKWWKEAKADGKITKEEIDELGKIIEEGKEEIKKK